MCLSSPFLNGLRQSFLRKPKHLLVTPLRPWLFSAGLPPLLLLLLLLLVLWVDRESSGPHIGGGLEVVFFDSGLRGGVVAFDSDSCIVGGVMVFDSNSRLGGGVMVVDSSGIGRGVMVFEPDFWAVLDFRLVLRMAVLDFGVGLRMAILD